MLSKTLPKMTRTLAKLMQNLPKLCISLSSGSRVNSLPKRLHRRRYLEQSLKEKNSLRLQTAFFFREFNRSLKKGLRSMDRLSHSGRSVSPMTFLARSSLRPGTKQLPDSTRDLPKP